MIPPLQASEAESTPISWHDSLLRTGRFRETDYTEMEHTFYNYANVGAKHEKMAPTLDQKSS